MKVTYRIAQGEPITLREILIYTVVLVAVSLLPGLLGLVGLTYLVAAAALGAIFLGYAVRLWREDRDTLAMRTFRWSIFYLFLLFGAFALDHVVHVLVLG